MTRPSSAKCGRETNGIGRLPAGRVAGMKRWLRETAVGSGGQRDDEARLRIGGAVGGGALPALRRALDADAIGLVSSGRSGIVTNLGDERFARVFLKSGLGAAIALRRLPWSLSLTEDNKLTERRRRCRGVTNP